MRSSILAAALLLVSAPAAHAATVAAASAQPVAIAQLMAGQSYTLAVTGKADLNVMYNNGAGLPFSADGKALNALPGVLAAFNAGTLVDPTSGLHALAANLAFGALVGSFTSTPGQSDYFALRDGMTLEVAKDATLFGLVNDSAYGDNAGGFQVAVNANAPVPEPATWALTIMGFGGIGYALRRRPKVGARLRFV